MNNSNLNENMITMKLDAIELSEQRPKLSIAAGAIKALQNKLRKFFNEADGHGSLYRKPPDKMVTPQYFKVIDCSISCYPIRHTDWISLVNSANFKRKFILGDGSKKILRSKTIAGGENTDKPHPSSPTHKKK